MSSTNATLPLPQVKILLERILDKVSNAPGTADSVLAGTKGLEAFSVLTIAIAERVGLEVATNDEILGYALTGGIPSPSVNKTGQLRAPGARGKLARYEQLRATDPRAAGQFYMENTDAICSELSQRRAEQLGKTK